MIKEYIRHWADLVNEESDETVNYAPLKVDVIRDHDEIVKMLPDVLDMVVSSYKDGYKGNANLKRLENATPMIKVVRDSDGNMIACSIYRRMGESFKVTGVGQNGTPDGKKALQEIIKSDIEPYDNWVWAEVSGAVEHYFKKYNGYPLPNEYAAITLEKATEKIKLLPDGFHYLRIIGQPGTDQDSQFDQKVIFGFKNRELADEVMSKVEYELKRKEFNQDVMTETGNDSSDLRYATSFINQLSDLYDEEGFRTLTPGLSGELDLAIDTLRKHKDEKDWIDDTLRNALSLRELMPEIRFF